MSKPLNIRLDDEVFTRLDEVCNTLGVSYTKFCTDLISDTLRQPEFYKREKAELKRKLKEADSHFKNAQLFNKKIQSFKKKEQENAQKVCFSCQRTQGLMVYSDAQAEERTYCIFCNESAEEAGFRRKKG